MLWQRCACRSVFLRARPEACTLSITPLDGKQTVAVLLCPVPPHTASGHLSPCLILVLTCVCFPCATALPSVCPFPCRLLINWWTDTWSFLCHALVLLHVMHTRKRNSRTGVMCTFSKSALITDNRVAPLFRGRLDIYADGAMFRVDLLLSRAGLILACGEQSRAHGCHRVMT